MLEAAKWSSGSPIRSTEILPCIGLAKAYAMSFFLIFSPSTTDDCRMNDRSSDGQDRNPDSLLITMFNPMAGWLHSPMLKTIGIGKKFLGRKQNTKNNGRYRMPKISEYERQFYVVHSPYVATSLCCTTYRPATPSNFRSCYHPFTGLAKPRMS